MSRNLNSLLDDAREIAPTWSTDREANVFEKMVTERHRRAFRAKIIRRGALASGIVCAVFLFCLRGLSASLASATPIVQPQPIGTAESVAQAQSTSDFIAAAASASSGDGGYSRD